MIQLQGLGTKLLESIATKLPLVAIEKGTSSLKVAIGARHNGAVEVEDFLVEDLSHIEPQGRAAYAKEKLSEFLKKRNISSAMAFLVVEDEDFFCTRVSLPSLASKKEIKQAVNWEIKDTLPFPENEAVADHLLISETQKADGSKSADMLYIALHKNTVDEAVSFLDGLNLTLENVNIVPGSLLNIFNQAAGFNPNESVAVLELGYNHTSISVFKDKKLIFTRRLLIGSSDITNSMLGAFSTNRGVVRLSYDDAEKIKQEYGILFETGSIRIHDSEIDSARVSSMMRPVLESLVAEIKNSFGYLYEKTQESNIAKVYLTGGGARLKNIETFLNQELGMPVEFLSVEGSAVVFSPDIAPEKKKELPYLVSVIGAMLNYPGGLDFLPAELRTKRREAIEWILLRMSSIVIVSVLLVSYLYMSVAQFYYGKRNKFIRLNESTMQSLLQIKQEIDLMQGIISTIKKGSTDGAVLLKELSMAIPSDVMLENVSYSESSGSGSLRLKGYIHGRQSDAGLILAGFMKNLEDSFLYENVNLSSSVEAGSEKDPVLNFSINCKIEARL